MKSTPQGPISSCPTCIPLEQTHHGQRSISISHQSTQPSSLHPNANITSTVCNTTYGCCGCDNCHGYNNLSNVPARLETYRSYQSQLGLPPKVFWGTPQAFGNSEFWKQTPTPDEEVAMTMLSINHGAKGIIMWTFPTTPDLTTVTSRLAKVLTGRYAGYLLGAELIGGLRINGAEMIDASVWKSSDSILVSIVNFAYEDAAGSVTLDLPAGTTAIGVRDVLWGDGEWRLSTLDSAAQIQRSSMRGMSTDILVLSLG